MSGPIQSVQRAAAVLELLGSVQEPLALGELARLLDLPKPTVHGLVRTLCDVGFAAQEGDTGYYVLDHRLRMLGGPLDPHLLRSRALTWADGLAMASGLEVQIGVPRGQQVELVHHVFRPDGSTQRLRIGELQPLAATALGRVLMAFSPVSSRARTPELIAFTPRTTTGRDELTREVNAVRRRGWAAVDGELRIGAAALAAPIRRRTGLVVGALAVVGRREEVWAGGTEPAHDLVTRVVGAAAAISENLQDRL